MTSPAPPRAPTIHVAVPGPWANRSDLSTALRRQGEGWVLAGQALKKAGQAELPIAMTEHDPQLGRAFAEGAAAAGLGPEELSAVGRHARVVWLALPAGPANAARLVEVSAALVKAGGVGVRIASSDKVWGPGAWLSLAAHGAAAPALYAAYVAIALLDDGYHSTGMQNLGQPDAIAPPDLTPERAGKLLNAFQLQILAHPSASPKEGQAFAEGPEAPRFVLAHEPCRRFPPDHPQHNPAGLWRLR